MNRRNETPIAPHSKGGRGFRLWPNLTRPLCASRAAIHSRSGSALSAHTTDRFRSGSALSAHTTDRFRSGSVSPSTSPIYFRSGSACPSTPPIAPERKCQSEHIADPLAKREGGFPAKESRSRYDRAGGGT